MRTGGVALRQSLCGPGRKHTKLYYLHLINLMKPSNVVLTERLEKNYVWVTKTKKRKTCTLLHQLHHLWHTCLMRREIFSRGKVVSISVWEQSVVC